MNRSDPRTGAAPAAGAPVRFGRFDIEARIGRGGMGDVYRGRIREGAGAGRPVALKRLSTQMALNPEALDMFLTEADVNRMLRHPNVVEVIEAGEHAGSYYIALELVEGHDLGAVLDRCRARGVRLPIDWSVQVVSQLLAALDFAHEATTLDGSALGVVHGDVSPGNVLVSSRTGEVKLGDFGTVRFLRLASEEASQVLPGVWGKPSYLPPEVLDGAPPGPSTDIWAAAVILYELLTNQPPFADPSFPRLVARIREANPVPPAILRPAISDDLSQIVLNALSADRDARYATAGWFRAVLAGFSDPQAGTPAAIAVLMRELFDE